MIPPTSVAFDSTGDLYITGGYSGRVQKVTPSGTTTFVAGTGTPGFSGDGGPAIAAQLRNPFGIAVDATGRMVGIRAIFQDRVVGVAVGI